MVDEKSSTVFDQKATCSDLRLVTLDLIENFNLLISDQNSMNIDYF